MMMSWILFSRDRGRGGERYITRGLPLAGRLKFAS